MKIGRPWLSMTAVHAHGSVYTMTARLHYVIGGNRGLRLYANGKLIVDIRPSQYNRYNAWQITLHVTHKTQYLGVYTGDADDAPTRTSLTLP